jgi:aryl-alcohol dehydrogenase-like predicted oxidoreductase
MPHRPSATPATFASNLNASHSTVGGSAAFAKRHSAFEAGFFRSTTFGITVSSIGIGTYLGDSTDVDDEAYERSVAFAIRSGANLIDTAINYRSQRSERSIGAAIQAVLASGDVPRDELVICSKAGYIPLELTPPATREEYRTYVRERFLDPQILHPDDIVAGGHSLAPRFLKYCLAKSRQNLGVRTIDVYYVHNPGQQLSGVSRGELLARLRTAFVSLEEAVARGEIGVYGCATWDELRVSPESKGHVALEEVVSLARDVAGDNHHFRAVQMPINFAMTEAVRLATQPLAGTLVPALEAAQELGLSVFASAPLLQARLTAGLPPAMSEAFPDCTTDAQRAVSFVRTLPGVTAALVGMRSLAHVEENLASALAR